MVKVVTRKNFVGVVAEKPWQAIQAAEKLKVSWTPGAGLPKQSGFHEHLRQQPSRDMKLVDSKDTQQTLATAATSAQVHLSIIPTKCTARWAAPARLPMCRAINATIYSPTQGVWYQKTACGNDHSA